MSYLLDIHYGCCHVADPDSGVVLNWDKGHFEKTKGAHTEGIIIVPENETLDSFVNGKLQQMEEWLKTKHPELL